MPLSDSRLVGKLAALRNHRTPQWRRRGAQSGKRLRDAATPHPHPANPELPGQSEERFREAKRRSLACCSRGDAEDRSWKELGPPRCHPVPLAAASCAPPLLRVLGYAGWGPRGAAVFAGPSGLPPEISPCPRWGPRRSPDFKGRNKEINADLADINSQPQTPQAAVFSIRYK